LTGIGSEISYAYNGDGLRMSKTVNGTKSSFSWDVSAGLSLALEDGTNAYVYGPVGLPLEQVSGSTALWFHHDQLGSTRLFTNGAGNTVAAYAYTPYGNMSGSSGTASTPLLYAGQYRDSESGFYYLRARYYDPTVGQFLSVDPDASVTRAPYSYAEGAPIDQSDPTGLDTGTDIECAMALATPVGRALMAGKLVLGTVKGFVGNQICTRVASWFNATLSQALFVYPNEAFLLALKLALARPPDLAGADIMQTLTNDACADETQLASETRGSAAFEATSAHLRTVEQKLGILVRGSYERNR
jgi:RHS repeat-associated protein